MNFTEYQIAALRTGTVDNESLPANLVHASLGIATESGEFITEVKRIVRYGRPLTPEAREHMIEELGDILWYIAIAAEALSTDMEHLAEENIAKLRKRFPEKYSNAAAEARADKSGLSARES